MHNKDKFKIVMHSNKPMKYRYIPESNIINELIDKSLLDEIDNLEIKGITHKSDFIRYTLLQNDGGIYIDTDIIILNSIEDLLNTDLFIAKQSSKMYCSGIIGSIPNYPLIKETRQAYYDDYHADKWAYNAMRIISENIESVEGNIIKLSIENGFHYPLYTNLSKMYELNPDFPSTLRGHHLWSSSPNGKKLIKYIEDNIFSTNNCYILRICRDILNYYKERI